MHTIRHNVQSNKGNDDVIGFCHRPFSISVNKPQTLVYKISALTEVIFYCDIINYEIFGLGEA